MANLTDLQKLLFPEERQEYVTAAEQDTIETQPIQEQTQQQIQTSTPIESPVLPKADTNKLLEENLPSLPPKQSVEELYQNYLSTKLGQGLSSGSDSDAMVEELRKAREEDRDSMRMQALIQGIGSIAAHSMGGAKVGTAVKVNPMETVNPGEFQAKLAEQKLKQDSESDKLLRMSQLYSALRATRDRQDNDGLTAYQQAMLEMRNKELGLREDEKDLNREEKRSVREEKMKEGTATQNLARGFGKRMEQAENAFQNLIEKGYDRSDLSSGLGKITPNILRSDEALMQEQAERNFVNAVLRRESGAAISEGEFESAEKQYFPRVGDGPETLKQKAENRKIVFENMKKEAGKTWGEDSLEQKQIVKKQYSKSANKTKLIYSDGTEEIVDGMQ